MADCEHKKLSHSKARKKLYKKIMGHQILRGQYSMSYIDGKF